AANAFIDHVSEAHLRIPLYIHTHSYKHRNDPGVLADRTVAHGAHAGVDQNLRHGIFGRLVLLALPGLVDSLNEINGMVIRDELQRIGDAVDQVLLTNHGWHSSFSINNVLA